jgi:hypothetical protein
VGARRVRLWLPGGRCEHVVDDFCAHANLYCDRQHLTSAVSRDRPGRVLTVAEIVDIGRQTWNDVAAVVAAEEEGPE